MVLTTSSIVAIAGLVAIEAAAIAFGFTGRAAKAARA